MGERRWTEGAIAVHIGRQTLARRCVLLVDRCTWTGHECDVLALTTDLRVIDVEIKISRSDLRADAKKDKWWHRPIGAWNQPSPPAEPRQWPPRVWKHYYAMPASIWTDELIAVLPSMQSGILLLSEHGGQTIVKCRRQATPDRGAYRLSPPEVMNIARLANLRMWDAYEQRDGQAAAKDYQRELADQEQEAPCRNP